MDNLKLWHKFLQTIKSEVAPVNFKAYFLKTLIRQVSEDKIILSTPSGFIMETLSRDYKSLTEHIFEKLLGRAVSVEFSVKEYEEPSEKDTQEFFQPIQTTQSSYLNPRYTLDNFVVGPTNNVAYAGAEAVSQNPGTSYNPLFIYGGTGVGKTHLMLAIGNSLLAKRSNLKIIYCASDKFMNDYVEAIQTHRMGDFRRKYRSLDILLIDDIQFFSGREGTQEEFFHTFNELQGRNAQMVITSDRPPHEIEKLEDRLKSRFQGGLMVDIQLPDFDTRVAILKAKCSEKGIVLEEEALRLLAASLDSNTRELEGKLMQIVQSLKLKGLSASAQNIIPFLNHQPKKETSDPKLVLSKICDFFNTTLKDLTGPKRQKELVLPRHFAMYILSEEYNMTVAAIGKLLGGRDHTTVMHGRDRVKELILRDRDVQRRMIELRGKIQ